MIPVANVFQFHVQQYPAAAAGAGYAGLYGNVRPGLSQNDELECFLYGYADPAVWNPHFHRAFLGHP